MAYALRDHTHHIRTTDRDAGVSSSSISLVLIDDHRLLREGLTALIQTQPGFRVLASSAAVEEALDRAREAKPDVVLLDFDLTDHSSLALTESVRFDRPDAKVIVMGLPPTQEDVADYIRVGASGFILRDASSEEFFDTIRQVAAGIPVLPQALTASLFGQITRNADTATRDRTAARVTAREREVIDALAEGLSNKEIAERLSIAVHTVKSHVHNVLEKLALHSRLEVVAFSHAASRESTALRR